MTDAVYIIVPVVVVVVILKVCLICWRVWAYQQRRQRQVVINQQQRRTRVQAPVVARVVRVERCVTDDGGFAQRTSYAVNQPGQPTRQFQRTILIRPADNRRPDDPNLPPSYDMAVTGKDKSVKVENDASTEATPPPPQQALPPAPPPSIPSVSHSQMGSFRSFLPSQPPVYSNTPRASATLPSTQEEEDEDYIPDDDRARLLS